MKLELIINNIIVFVSFLSLIIIITQGIRIWTWLPKIKTPVIYGIKRLNTILKS